MYSWYRYFKNRHLLMIAPVESEFSVVRVPRLLWEIDMFMMKLANINFMWWDAIEIFLEGHEIAVISWKNSPFEVTTVVTSKGEFFQVMTAISGASKKVSMASHQIKFMFTSFIMNISICQSKWGTRTTLNLDSTGAITSKSRCLKYLYYEYILP